MLQTLITMLDSFAVHTRHAIEIAVLAVFDYDVIPFMMLISMIMLEIATMIQTDVFGSMIQRDTYH